MDISEIGRQFGLNEAQTRAAFEQLAPVVAAGIRRNNQSDNGLEGLLKALQAGGHGRYAEDPSALQFDRVADDGNAILGHVFGSKDVSRGVANQAADLSGVGSAVLKKMLPVIAAIIMGQLAKRMGGGSAGSPAPGGGTGGGLGDILGDILGGGKQSAPKGGSAGTPTPGGGLEDILGDILGGGRSQGGASPNAPRPQPGSVSIEDLLREMMGGGQGGGAGGGGYNQEVTERSRKRIDDVLGGGTKSGNAADDLLNSVDRVTRKR